MLLVVGTRAFDRECRTLSGSDRRASVRTDRQAGAVPGGLYGRPSRSMTVGRCSASRSSPRCC